MSDNQQSKRLLWQQKVVRVYVSGLVLSAGLYVAWSALIRFSPWFSQFENPLVALIITFATLIVVPPILGLFVQVAINPILGKWNGWSELIRLEEQLAGEIASGRQTGIVLVNCPSEKERTIGVMTNVFPATDELPELASVYLPLGPRAKTGYVRIVPVSDVRLTGWTLREFQLYQLTIGSVSPADLIQPHSSDCRK